MDRLTPAQIRGARGMLDWSMIDLARAAGVSVAAVKRAGTDSSTSVPGAMMDKIRGAFEMQGVGFLTDEGNGPGMRLQPHPLAVLSRFT